MGKFQSKKPSAQRREEAEIEASFRQVTGGKDNPSESNPEDSHSNNMKKNKKIIVESEFHSLVRKEFNVILCF